MWNAPRLLHSFTYVACSAVPKMPFTRSPTALVVMADSSKQRRCFMTASIMTWKATADATGLLAASCCSAPSPMSKAEASPSSADSKELDWSTAAWKASPCAAGKAEWSRKACASLMLRRSCTSSGASERKIEAGPCLRCSASSFVTSAARSCEPQGTLRAELAMNGRISLTTTVRAAASPAAARSSTSRKLASFTSASNLAKDLLSLLTCAPTASFTLWRSLVLARWKMRGSVCA
mmetsp:Transcript_24300/g.61702  ORF Transcript_24300/g.61702 Transcript_24300/m.61702 type:complete len:236 (-) Transcript_24300:184-891(-)